MFEDLDGDVGLKTRYARPDVDWVSRMDSDDPIEKLVRYWRSKIDVKVDKNSGTVSVAVRAFTPEDALAIAQDIADRSERLANELSERARHDALSQAKEELAQAERSMLGTINALRQTRNEQGILDATKTAEALTKVIADLRGKLLFLEGEYKVQSASVAPSAPQMKILASRVANLKDQIAGLEQRIAGGVGHTTLADMQEALERRGLEAKLAEQQYAMAVAKFEQARLDQAAKQIYLMAYVSPRLAEDALYPKRLLTLCIILLSGLALWGSGVGVAVMIRDHMAV
jgi:capsular polysaccharide transport system permease protein